MCCTTRSLARFFAVASTAHHRCPLKGRKGTVCVRSVPRQSQSQWQSLSLLLFTKKDILNLKLILNFFKVRLEWLQCSQQCKGRAAQAAAIARWSLDISSSQCAHCWQIKINLFRRCRLIRSNIFKLTLRRSALAGSVLQQCCSIIANSAVSLNGEQNTNNKCKIADRGVHGRPPPSSSLSTLTSRSQEVSARSLAHSLWAESGLLLLCSARTPLPRILISISS